MKFCKGVSVHLGSQFVCITKYMWPSNHPKAGLFLNLTYEESVKLYYIIS